MVDDTQFELLQSEMEKDLHPLKGLQLMLRNGNFPHPPPPHYLHILYQIANPSSTFNYYPGASLKRDSP
jgi:hypothetical protein